MPAAITTFEVRNDLSELDRIQDTLEAFLAPLGCTGKALFQIKLALEEVFVNIVSHGYPENGEHFILVSFSYENSVFTMVVEDDAMAFDPTAADAPDLTQPLTCRDPGGLGVHLLRWCCAVDYARKGDKNILTIKKTLC